jgi:hypothetical protein
LAGRPQAAKNMAGDMVGMVRHSIV